MSTFKYFRVVCDRLRFLFEVLSYDFSVCFRMIASEDVQYFKFDSECNMFVYEPGAGFSGDCHLVSPGD